MGGTFDPIHMGHLILGEQSYEQLKLDKVLFMPAGNPPHKKNRIGRAADEQRVDMVRLAISDNPHFELSLAEMNETGYLYLPHSGGIKGIKSRYGLLFYHRSRFFICL